MQTILSIIRNACLTLRALVSEISTTKQCFDALLSRVSTLALPVPNPSNAFWQQYPPFPDLVNRQSPQLPGTADILIIGSGISGASVVYTALKQAHSHAHPQPPPRVVVLEARSICSGATGRNGGHIKCSAYLEYASLKARFGKERAKALLEFQLSHMPILLDLIQRNDELKCAEAREVQSVDTFTDEKTWVKTKRTVEEFRRDVPDLAGDVVVHEGVDACTEFGVDPQHCHGIITYKAAALWPYRFVTALYSSLLSAHPELISLEANTPATEIRVNPEDSERPFTVQTPRGAISATHIVHATDAFTANLVPGLTGKLFPVRGHMTAQEPGSLFPALDGTRSWSVIHQRGFDYISQRPGAGELLVGGGMVQSPDKGMDEFGVWRDDQSCYSIRAYLDGLLPTIFGAQNWGADRGESRVRMAWTGCMGFTPDLLPFVGRLDPKLTGRTLPPRSSGQAKQPAEWISAGFQGEGMVMAWLSGVAVGLMVIGDEDKFLEETPGIPAGKMSDWLPKEMVCSKRRVDGSSVSDLATLL